MDLDVPPLAIIAASCALIGVVPYVRAILAGQARPQRATWTVYVLVGLCACASSYAAGARDTLWVPLAYALGPVVILALAIRRGVGGWSRLDRACLIIAAMGLAGWLLLDEPRIGVVLHTLADIAGTAPTLRKAWREPASEPLTPWLWFFAASSLNLALIQHLSIGEALYPIWLCLSCMLIIGALITRRAPVGDGR